MIYIKKKIFLMLFLYLYIFIIHNNLLHMLINDDYGT